MTTGPQVRIHFGRRHSCEVWLCIAFSAVAALINSASVKAQQASPVYVLGNGAVTGFSGALPPPLIPPGVDPNQKTFIDPNGPALRIVDLQHLGGPPLAQLVGAPKSYTFMAAQLGQVFGVALDGNSPPNIYAAATSVYGLPIIAPGPDGQPQHVKVGTAGATFMPGLWGPQGGPGSIWKIDGATGAVRMFATVTTGGRANSGAALGGLAYDPDTKMLYVSDRESGLIHRIGPNGDDLGTYDHGVSGRAAQGLPSAPWTTPKPIDVTNPQFDTTQPTTWNYPAPERRVFGIVIHERRLYYAVADSLQIWSVGLNDDGSFGKDAVIELAVPPSTGPTEISKITFDEQGRMFLADRPAPTGAFDFKALAVQGIGRVLRYALIEIMSNGRRVWQQQPDEYAIGFPPDFRNGNGGVAIGYNYDHNGNLVPGSCGGFMWSTGEDLRAASDKTLAARLGQSGPLDINGLQGNGTWRIRHGNEPPTESYFIDYSDEFHDPAERGHLGDIDIERLCSPVQRAELLPYGGAPPIGTPPGSGPPATRPPGTPPPPPGNKPPYTPPGGCQPNEIRNASTGACGSCSPPNIQVGATCCSVAQLAANAACSNSACQPGQTAIGPSNFCCNNGKVYTGANGAPACCSGPLVNGQCPPPPPPPISTCPSGYVSIGSACCLASQVTSTGACCPSGQVPSGPNKSQCKPPPILIPVGPLCLCGAGQIPTASGKCCPPANVTTSGVCCSGPVDPTNRTSCPVPICATGYTRMPDGSCCNSRYVSRDGKSCNTGVRQCGPGEFRDLSGACAPMPPARGCAPGEVLNPAGECAVVPPPAGCPAGQVLSRRGECVVVPPPAGCPAGEILSRRGKCVPSAPPPRTRGHKEHHGGVVPPSRAGPRRPGTAAAPPPRPGFRGPFGGRRGFFRR